MRKRFFTVMAAALVVSGMPVMAKETSTEEKISEAVEETKDSTEAESVVSGNETSRGSGTVNKRLTNCEQIFEKNRMASNENS